MANTEVWLARLTHLSLDKMSALTKCNNFKCNFVRENRSESISLWESVSWDVMDGKSAMVLGNGFAPSSSLSTKPMKTYIILCPYITCTFYYVIKQQGSSTMQNVANCMFCEVIKACLHSFISFYSFVECQRLHEIQKHGLWL